MGQRRSRTTTGAVLLAATGLVASVGSLTSWPSAPVAGAAITTVVPVSDPASLVDPMIGTAGDGHTFPAADLPFGMVQFGPDTPSRPPGGGYARGDAAITGFSLTHLSGTGCAAYGDVPILPTVGPIGPDPGSASQPFTHTGETASPGSYGVTLGSTPIRTELAVTARTGLGQFTFPPSTAANLLIKTGASAAGNDAASAVVIGPDTVVGSATSGHFCGSAATYTVYVAVRFSRPFTAYGAWTPGTVTAGAPISQGSGSGLYVTFDTTADRTVTAQIGVSFVSVAGAVTNLRAEQPGWDPAPVRQAAHTAWNAMLGRVEIGGGLPADQRTFFTALYHSLLHPNVFSDADGSYPGFDGQIHTAGGGAHYANLSGWDVYRSQIPLLSLLVPDVASDIVRSMLDDAAQNGGLLPKWSLANGETFIMVGDPAAPIIAGAYAFGARAFDAAQAQQLLVAQATVANRARPGLDYERTLGYLPTDGVYGCCSYAGPVSTTLEDATADFAISRLAAARGDATTTLTFTQRATAWQHLLQGRDGLFQQKLTSGQFLVGPNPTTGYGYVEGDALQYAWSVPHDLRGLINGIGGNAVAVSRLDRLFAQLNAGPNAPFAFMGNEPAFGLPWTYVYAGAPWRTQDVVRRIQSTLFSAAPTGLPGNDDLGAMSSWYVWSALGLYPETPGTADVVLGSPLFPLAVVHLGNGRALTINAPDASRAARYVTSLAVDGAATTRAWLPAARLLGGATLDVALGTAPNRSFGNLAADAPPSYSGSDRPVIGSTDPSGALVLPPGSTRTLRFAIRNTTNTSVSATWTASTAGVGVTPGSGTMSVPAAGVATVAVPVTAPAAPGTYQIRFDITAAGTAMIPVVLRVVVAAPGDLGAHADNTGISDDADRPAASLDFSNFSYSRQALAAVGLVPGGSVTVGGLTYPWPRATGGPPDNIVAAGQRLDLPPRPGATTLGFLGSSSNGGAGAHGTATVTYTDGSAITFDLGLTDWTRGAGSLPVAFGNQTVTTAAYLNCQCGVSWPIAASLFQDTVSLDPARTVASVTLPRSVSAGDLHVFAIALG